MDELQDTHKGLKKEFTEQVSNWRQDKERREVLHRSKLEEQEQRHGTSLSHVLQERDRQSEEQEAQHGRALATAAAELEEAQGNLQEMTRRYQHRESREEDISRVRILELKVREEIQARKRAVEDLKFYKLELLNREENFNQKFGGGRTVGVLSTAKKGGGQGGGNMRVAGPTGPFGSGTGGARNGSQGSHGSGPDATSNRMSDRKPPRPEPQRIASYDEDFVPQTGNFGLPPVDPSRGSGSSGERRPSNGSGGSGGGPGGQGSRPGTRGGSASFDAHRARRVREGGRENSSPDFDTHLSMSGSSPGSFTPTDAQAY
jgi:hypothetical protein